MIKEILEKVENQKSKYKVKNKDELIKIIKNAKPNEDLNYLDVSGIIDMSGLFENSKFNGDISKWNVSNVEDMSYMFAGSNFNGDISKWDVKNVENMAYMFYNSSFNKDISKWDVKNVESMFCMFEYSDFSKCKNLEKWKINPECDITYMFNECKCKNYPSWYSEDIDEKLKVNVGDSVLINGNWYRVEEIDGDIIFVSDEDGEEKEFKIKDIEKVEK